MLLFQETESGAFPWGTARGGWYEPGELDKDGEGRREGEQLRGFDLRGCVPLLLHGRRVPEEYADLAPAERTLDPHRRGVFDRLLLRTQLEGDGVGFGVKPDKGLGQLHVREAREELLEPWWWW